MTNKCEHCGAEEGHPGVCPTIKAIEYYDFGGAIKRVEYKCAADYGPALFQVPPPFPGHLVCGGAVGPIADVTHVMTIGPSGVVAGPA